MPPKDYYEQLHSMSNFEINREVALALGFSLEIDEHFEKKQIGDSLSYYDDERVIHSLFEDYCDRPELAYPVILENKISVYWKGGVDDLWFARNIHTPKVEDVNPLRAALVVFLILKSCE